MVRKLHALKTAADWRTEAIKVLKDEDKPTHFDIGK